MINYLQSIQKWHTATLAGWMVRVLATAWASCFLCFSSSAQAQDVIKIGAILTTSGPAAALGEPQLKTLQLLTDEVNARGGIHRKKVQIIAYDDAGDSQKATVFAKRLIDSDHVDFIIGPTASGPTMAIIPIIQQAEIPNISLAGAAAIVEPVKPWVFKVSASDAMAARTIFAHMKKEGINKLAILHDTGGFGRASLVQFQKIAPEFGVSIVAVESYGPKDTDTSVQITKMKSSPAEAFLVLGIMPAPALVTKNYRDLGMSQPLYHTHASATPEFLSLAGAAADGVRIPVPPIAFVSTDQGAFRPVVERYSTAYQKRFGATPSVFAGFAHDAVSLAFAAFQAAGSTDKGKVRAALESIPGLKGVNGTYNYSPSDHLGLSSDALSIAVVRKGQFERIR